MRSDASWTEARKLSSRLSYRVETDRKLFILLIKLDVAPLPIEDRIEGRETFSGRHEPDAGCGTASREAVAQPAPVIALVGEQGLACTDAIDHIRALPPVMGLTPGQLQADRATQSVNKSMDFRGQPTARATHAMGSVGFFDRWRRVGAPG